MKNPLPQPAERGESTAQDAARELREWIIEQQKISRSKPQDFADKCLDGFMTDTLRKMDALTAAEPAGGASEVCEAMIEFTESVYVDELIAVLQTMPKGYKVCVAGCDGIGVYDITQIVPDERGFIEIYTFNSNSHEVETQGNPFDEPEDGPPTVAKPQADAKADRETIDRAISFIDELGDITREDGYVMTRIGKRTITDLHALAQLAKHGKASTPQPAWHPIESEADLPEIGRYFYTDKEGEVGTIKFNNRPFDREMWMARIVAYIPVPKPY